MTPPALIRPVTMSAMVSESIPLSHRGWNETKQIRDTESNVGPAAVRPRRTGVSHGGRPPPGRSGAAGLHESRERVLVVGMPAGERRPVLDNVARRPQDPALVQFPRHVVVGAED